MRQKRRNEVEKGPNEILKVIEELPRCAMLKVFRLPHGPLVTSTATFSRLQEESALVDELIRRANNISLKSRSAYKAEEVKRQKLVELVIKVESALENVSDKKNAAILAEVQDALEELKDGVVWGHTDESIQVYLDIDHIHDLSNKLYQATVRFTPLDQALAINAPLSLEEVCEYLKRSRATVYRNIANDDLPAHRLPGRRGLFFFHNEVDEWLKTQGGRELKTKGAGEQRGLKAPAESKGARD